MKLAQMGRQFCGSNAIRTAATVKTNIRCGLAIGPINKFATPFAFPTARTYAVRIARQAATYPNTGKLLNAYPRRIVKLVGRLHAPGQVHIVTFDDDQPLQDTDVRCGDPDAWSGAHRVGQIASKPVQVFVKDRYGLGDGA